MRITLAERFARRVDKTPGHGPNGDCWHWIGSRNRDGYGRFEVNGAEKKSHRMAYELLNGLILPGMCVCHACDNPQCVKPAHLWLGTVNDNIRDRMAKGRTANGQMKMTHCKNGHLLGGNNAYPGAKTRQCRTCHNARSLVFSRANMKTRPAL